MMEQGSAEWLAARLGKVGASRVADIIAKTKSGWSASRANYMAELVAERLTGSPTEKFTSAAMQWGTDCEAEARAAYQFETGTVVTKVGFIPHPAIAMAGASPDGMIGDMGLLECKCPNTATHIDTLRGGSVPGKYVTQMQWQMACTGRQWCDFVSFDPRMPESMRLFVKRVPRDGNCIAELETQVRQFIRELDETVADLRSRYETREAA
jgi:putative phage-type endonuclease